MTNLKHFVFLTGFMASGKSTIGPELARKIGYDFVDVDDLIEESERISVSEIFKTHGEKYFREIEKKTIESLSGGERNTVVALGGGTLMNEGSRRLVRSRGMLVYIKASPVDIFERVKRKKDRPMLLTPNGGTLDDTALLSRVESLIKEREPYYSEADVIISISGMTVSKSVEAIASRLKGKIA